MAEPSSINKRKAERADHCDAPTKKKKKKDKPLRISLAPCASSSSSTAKSTAKPPTVVTSSSGGGANPWAQFGSLLTEIRDTTGKKPKKNSFKKTESTQSILPVHQASLISAPRFEVSARQKYREMNKKRRGLKEGRDDLTMNSLKGELLLPAIFREEDLVANPVHKVFRQHLVKSGHKLSPDEIEEFYDRYEITVPDTTPPPVLCFDDIDFGPEVNAALKKRFARPMPIQSIAWPSLFMGWDCICLAETGSGKTLGFALPALVHIKAQNAYKSRKTNPPKIPSPVALFVAPTRELASQIAEESKAFAALAGINVGLVHGDASKVLTQANQLSLDLDILVATLGRLVDYAEAGIILLSEVTYLVLDEADEMLQRGFIHQLDVLVSQFRPDRQTLMFSATWVDSVREICEKYLNPRHVKLIVNKAESHHKANPNIKQHVIMAKSDTDKCTKLVGVLAELNEKYPKDCKVLIFANRCLEVTQVAELLKVHYVDRVACLYGGLPQSERLKAMEFFRTSSDGIMVASDVASRGLDVRGVCAVINFDMPKSIDRYVHRIGRTGRAGSHGVAYTFFVPHFNSNLALELIRCMEEAKQTIPPELAALKRKIADPAAQNKKKAFSLFAK